MGFVVPSNGDQCEKQPSRYPPEAPRTQAKPPPSSFMGARIEHRRMCR